MDDAISNEIFKVSATFIAIIMALEIYFVNSVHKIPYSWSFAAFLFSIALEFSFFSLIIKQTQKIKFNFFVNASCIIFFIGLSFIFMSMFPSISKIFGSEVNSLDTILEMAIGTLNEINEGILGFILLIIFITPILLFWFWNRIFTKEK